MKNTYRWLLIAALTLIVLVFAIHKYQWTTVTEGELLGIRIGSSKSEVFQRLLELEGISSLQPGETIELSVTLQNLDDLQALMRHDAVVLRSDASQTVIYSQDGRILRIASSGAGWRLQNDFKTVDELVPALREEFLNGNITRGFVTVKGYTGLYDRVHVSTESRPFDPEEPGFVWLLAFNTWFFRGPETWATITLDFEDNRLTRIARYRVFGESL